MNLLGERINYIMNNLKDGEMVTQYWTSSRDNHEVIHESILPISSTYTILYGLLKEYEEYGNCAGTDPKGNWIKIVDFKILN